MPSGSEAPDLSTIFIHWNEPVKFRIEIGTALVIDPICVNVPLWLSPTKMSAIDRKFVRLPKVISNSVAGPVKDCAKSSNTDPPRPMERNAPSGAPRMFSGLLRLFAVPTVPLFVHTTSVALMVAAVAAVKNRDVSTARQTALSAPKSLESFIGVPHLFETFPLRRGKYVTTNRTKNKVVFNIWFFKPIIKTQRST
jgi:hypothetical protein